MGILESILFLLAGCGVFMTGMKLMSDGLERSAGSGMKKLFGKISNNRFAGIGVGAAVTAIIQSSSATTVMVIGFVNAGIMTLVQATAIIMGANIGTTVTGIIISFSAFNIAMWAMALSLVGVLILMFSKNDLAKKIGGVLTGLGLIFVGLNIMSDAFENEGVKNAFYSLFKTIDFPLLLILFGMIFTGIIQSSSAATGLIITMVGQGVLDLKLALFVVLGTNIGTCVTAILASVGASTNAKRAAFIHLVFNIIGTIIFTIVLWIFAPYVVKLLEFLIPGAPQMQIAWFHVGFNVITTAILVPFVNQLPRFSKFVIREKPGDDHILKLHFIDDRILNTPPIAVAQVIKEVINMAELAKQNLTRAFSAIENGDISEKDKILLDESKINFINKGVARYLIKISSLSLGASDEKLIGTLHHVISDIERIGDHAENFIETAEDLKQSGVVFSSEAAEELKNMYAKVVEMFDLSLKVFKDRDTKNFSNVAALENEIDEMKRTLGNNHIKRLNAGNCSVESGTHFYAIITALERVADHLTNIAFSIKSPSGSQKEALMKVAERERHHAVKKEKDGKEIKEKDIKEKEVKEKP